MIQYYFSKLSECDQQHCLRVEELSLRIAGALPDHRINLQELQISARYHDVGKIRVPQKILSKKSALTPEERKHMMVHSKYSSQILENTGHDRNVVRYAMLHHENYDGTGYPFGFKKSQIPIEARIIRVADVFDALHSERSYKAALPIDLCLKIMHDEKHAYDPSVLIVLEEIL